MTIAEVVASQMVGTADAVSAVGLDPETERILDLLGIFVFAISGAMMAVRKQYDMVGVVALAAITALGGGLVRDGLLGDTPPPGLTDTAYLGVPLAAALITLVGHRQIEQYLYRPHLASDAAGLGLFCVAGTTKALSFGLTGLGAVALGVVTATGGGVMRDVLAGEQPTLFRRETVLYGIPAALGSTVIAVAWELDVLTGAFAGVVAAAVCVLRLVALKYGWHAPRPRR